MSSGVPTVTVTASEAARRRWDDAKGQAFVMLEQGRVAEAQVWATLAVAEASVYAAAWLAAERRR